MKKGTPNQIGVPFSYKLKSEFAGAKPLPLSVWLPPQRYWDWLTVAVAFPYTCRAFRPRFRGFMAKEEPIQLEGQVTEVLPNATFRAQLTNGHNVLATLGGNMRRFRIRVLQGDRVTIEVSPYDLTRGRITYRHK